MLQVDLQIDQNKLRNLIRSVFAIGEEAKKEVRTALKVASRDTINDARHIHRFQTRSGKLERYTMFEMAPRDMRSRLFINDAAVPYGKWIHEGFKSWRPDQYLYQSVERNTNHIYSKINDGIDRAIKKAGFN